MSCRPRSVVPVADSTLIDDGVFGTGAGRWHTAKRGATLPFDAILWDGSHLGDGLTVEFLWLEVEDLEGDGIFDAERFAGRFGRSGQHGCRIGIPAQTLEI